MKTAIWPPKEMYIFRIFKVTEAIAYPSLINEG